ncbi:hypothetical protein ACWF82_27380 [Nocardia sp. NPDC055053]
MSTEPERRVELGKDRVQDAPESSAPPPAPTERMWVNDAPPAELPPPAPAQPELPWAGIERPAPPVELPPYPPPPPAPLYPQAYPVPGRVGYGAPRYPLPYQPVPMQRYGYADSTPIWSIISFCCVAASVVGGAMLCGLPILVTAPTGIVLGIVGHAKGEQMGKWAAIANGVVAALAALAVVLFVVALGSL